MLLKYICFFVHWRINREKEMQKKPFEFKHLFDSSCRGPISPPRLPAPLRFNSLLLPQKNLNRLRQFNLVWNIACFLCFPYLLKSNKKSGNKGLQISRLKPLLKSTYNFLFNEHNFMLADVKMTISKAPKSSNLSLSKGIESLPQTLVFKSLYLNNPML